MKALYLYSDKTGIKKPKFYQDQIIKYLSKYYELTAKKTSSVDEFKNECIHAKENGFEAVIVAGGDGTFNLACSTFSDLDESNRPIIGYVPMGTINDSGKTFGASNISKALKILKKQSVNDFDICRVNDSYFTYVCAIGQYSDISYITERREKKCFGRLSYYRIAIKEAFQKKIVNVKVTTEDKVYEVQTPFVLIMSGVSVGGFKINAKKSYNDGYFDVYLTKPGIFNGLLHYLFFKVKTIHFKAKKIKVSTDQNGPWCLDGEKGLSGDVEIECLHSHLKIFGKRKNRKTR